MSETPDTLRALAEAANEQRSNVGWYAAVDIDITGTFEACELMAACSPKAILALLDERDTLRAEVARLTTEREAFREAARLLDELDTGGCEFEFFSHALEHAEYEDAIYANRTARSTVTT